MKWDCLFSESLLYYVEYYEWEIAWASVLPASNSLLSSISYLQ